ncbi:hypothetical protein K469DRAFT_480008, partial [Zopfia rhizophila CBS 207.26]
DPATRAQAIALHTEGVPNSRIREATGLGRSTIKDIVKEAKARGYDPEVSKTVTMAHVIDKPRSGRPCKGDEETQQVIIEKVTLNRYGREKGCEQIANKLNKIRPPDNPISATTVWRLLRTAGFRKTKPTRKPGLSPQMKKDQLQFCLDHKDWTLEN